MTRTHTHQHKLASNGHPRDDSPAADHELKPAFCVASSEKHRVAYQLSMPLFIAGLGTTGCTIVRRMIDRLSHALGRLPSAINYLLIDAVAPPLDHHHQHFISLDLDGCGSNPHVGRQTFFSFYVEIKNAYLHFVDEIMRGGDSLLRPAKTARDQMCFFLVGSGSGGTSGGILDPAISLTHDVAQQLNIPPRVHVTMLSPDMILKDITRQPIPEQAAMIPATYAQNMSRILGLMQLDAQVCERRPDGSEFYVKAQHRVFALHKVDRSNGAFDFSTTEDLVSTVADAFHLYLLTAAGQYVDERDRDNVGLGAAGCPISSVNQNRGDTCSRHDQ